MCNIAFWAGLKIDLTLKIEPGSTRNFTVQRREIYTKGVDKDSIQHAHAHTDLRNIAPPPLSYFSVVYKYCSFWFS